MNLTGAVILITGGSSGLGKAMAQDLKSKGAKVIITGRDGNKLSSVESELEVDAFHADVANDDDIKSTFQYIKDKYTNLDVLINNAGVGEFSLLEDLTRAEMLRTYEVNVFGAALMAAEAVKMFKTQNYGNIINIASTASMKGFKYGTVYASSKFALRGMTQCWQAELRPFNVRVIQINPSEVPTAFAAEDRKEKDLEVKKLTPQEISQSVVGALEMDDRGFIPELTVHATNPF